LDHLEGAGNEKERRRIEAHLSRCAACRRTFEEFRQIAALTLQRQAPHPGDEFWKKFDHELDARLNERLAGRGGGRPAFLPWPLILGRKPAWVLTSLTLIVVAVGLRLLSGPFYFQPRDAKVEVLTQDMILLDELDRDNGAWAGSDEDLQADMEMLLFSDPRALEGIS
jgi:hypothetical protein